MSQLVSERWQAIAKTAKSIWEDGPVNVIPLSHILAEAAKLGMEACGSNVKLKLHFHWAYAPFRLILAQILFLIGEGLGGLPSEDHHASGGDQVSILRDVELMRRIMEAEGDLAEVTNAIHKYNDSLPLSTLIAIQ